MNIKPLITFLAFFSLSVYGYGQEVSVADSAARRESFQKKLYHILSRPQSNPLIPDAPHIAFNGMAGIGAYYTEHLYISGRRGLSEEEWERRSQLILEKVNQSNSNREQLIACRYFGLLTQDAHFEFPDDGQFNRSGFFQKTDIIFPIWVKTWKDGSVYTVKDYTGQIPPNSSVLSVNGRSAKEMALTNRAIAPGEEAIAMASMNAQYEASPQSWPNFPNFLFLEGITPPYEVVYIPPGSETADTIVLGGMTRGEIVKQFKRSGDKRRLDGFLSMPRVTPVVYENRGDSIGVLSINSFWGRSIVELLVFKKDWRYKKQLKRAMRRIDRDGITDLVIDVSSNSGGMRENMYHTLSYLTDKPAGMNGIYHITDRNRELVKANISNSPEITKAARDSLVGYIDKLESETVFSTDTVCRLYYTPTAPARKFMGNVYVLTGNQTYSAAQMFARYCQVLDIGPVAGEHCGGYTEITGGNAVQIPLPRLEWLTLKVPYSATRICETDDPYDYPPVDIPIEQPFEEWLKGENRNVDRLVEVIGAERLP